MKPKKASFERLTSKLNQLQHDNSNSCMIPIIKNEINQRNEADRIICVAKSGPILAQIKTQAVRNFINSIKDKQ